MDGIEKKYFTISEVAKKMDVAPSLIRFWERQFVHIRPRKNKNGVRRYTQDDIERLQTIYYLVKEKGFTLQGANEVLLQKSEKIDHTVGVIKELEEIKAFLENLKELLNQS